MSRRGTCEAPPLCLNRHPPRNETWCDTGMGVRLRQHGVAGRARCLQQLTFVVVRSCINRLMRGRFPGIFGARSIFFFFLVFFFFFFLFCFGPVTIRGRWQNVFDVPSARDSVLLLPVIQRGSCSRCPLGLNVGGREMYPVLIRVSFTQYYHGTVSERRRVQTLSPVCLLRPGSANTHFV